MNRAAAFPLDLVTGGAHAGKSEWAVCRWKSRKEVLFVGCAVARDARTKVRLETLQQQRPESWTTLELLPGDQSLADLERGLQNLSPEGALLLDGFNLWLAGTLVQSIERYSLEQIPHHCDTQTQEFLRVLHAHQCTAMVVTGETGFGIAPANASGRLLRELLGLANQRLAAHANSVHLVVSGCGLKVK